MQGQRELVAQREARANQSLFKTGDLSISLLQVDGTPRLEEMKDSGWDVGRWGVALKRNGLCRSCGQTKESKGRGWKEERGSGESKRLEMNGK